MARRWVAVGILALAWAGPASHAGGDGLASADATLAFTTRRGIVPAPQAVPLGAHAEPVRPEVRYGGAEGWLQATVSVSVSGTTVDRSLIVQPRPFMLGPGVYRATIHLTDAVHPPKHVNVALAVLASSGAACPPSSTLRYEGRRRRRRRARRLRRTFFASYCVSCHASAKDGDARAGAPRGLDWDVPSTIRAHRDAIDKAAARGPAASHDNMPPAEAPRRPSDAERALLARWIACGAP